MTLPSLRLKANADRRLRAGRQRQQQDWQGEYREMAHGSVPD